jgi:dTDP-4-dehydrorhamnose 3,5-epimerase
LIVRFTPAPLAGAHVIDIEPLADERGFFARNLCLDEFLRHGINARMVQQSVSWNPRRGTLRGLHFQSEPHAEDKLVRVTQGAVFDVIVDLRMDSSTRGQWFGIELSAQNHKQLYIPRGMAHGFQTLEDNTEVFYQMTVPYQPGAARGLRWDDPALAIPWPLAELARTGERISERDLQWPLLLPDAGASA